MDFRKIVQEHLDVVIKKDIVTFQKYLSPMHEPLVILPSGDILQGYDAVLDFHKDWFADADWVMKSEIIDAVQLANMGYGLVDVTYNDLDENGQPYKMKYLLSMVFVNIEGEWILLRDQNTLK